MKQALPIALATICVLVVGIVIGSAVTRAAHRQEAESADAHAPADEQWWWSSVTPEAKRAAVRAWADYDRQTAEQNRLADELDNR